jgi:hypothetical protein
MRVSDTVGGWSVVEAGDTEVANVGLNMGEEEEAEVGVCGKGKKAKGDIERDEEDADDCVEDEEKVDDEEGCNVRSGG